MDPEDYGVGRSILKHGDYGREELEVLGQYLKPEFKVLVVGAHIGTLVIPVSKRVESVYAVEANPKTFQLLSMNVALNQVKNVTIEQIAASDKQEKISFLLSRANSGGSKRVPKNYNIAYYYDRPETIEVDAVPLDQHLQEAFDVIIMDIEGSEFFALSGMPNILSAAKVLQIEFLPHHLKNVSGVTVSQFLSTIEAYFDQLFIPSLGVTVGKEKFQDTLQAMYDAEEGDNGIIFTK